MNVKRLPNGQYRVRYTDESGDDVRRVLEKGTTLDEAKQYDREARVRVDRIKAGLEVRDRNPQRKTVGDIARSYMKGLSPSNQLDVTRHILETPLADMPLERVTPAKVKAHLDGLKPSDRVRGPRRKKLGAATINHIRKYLVGAFELAIDEEQFVGANPVRRVKLRRVTRRPLVTLTPAEVARVLGGAPFPAGSILAVALHGLRRSEVWNLDVRDIDLEAWTIHVRKSKTDRERVVPINKALRPLVARAVQLSTSTVLFPSRHRGYGKRQKRRSPKTSMAPMLRAALAAADIDRHIRPHDLRHTCATMMLAAGAQLQHVKDVLGHRTIRLTADLYGHLVVDDLRDAVDRMPIKLAPTPKRRRA